MKKILILNYAYPLLMAIIMAFTTIACGGGNSESDDTPYSPGSGGGNNALTANVKDIGATYAVLTGRIDLSKFNDIDRVTYSTKVGFLAGIECGESVNTMKEYTGTRKEGSFDITIIDLEPNTKYYYRTYIVPGGDDLNKLTGGAFRNIGETMTFTTKEVSFNGTMSASIYKESTLQSIFVKCSFNLSKLNENETYTIGLAYSPKESDLEASRLYKNFRNTKYYEYGGVNEFYNNFTPYYSVWDSDLRFALLDKDSSGELRLEVDPGKNIYFCPFIFFGETAFAGEIKSTSTIDIETSDFVDIGLSCLWSSKNLGASSPMELGRTYSLPVSKSALSSGERVPTEQEVKELNNKCKFERTENGLRITGPNNKSIHICCFNDKQFKVYLGTSTKTDDYGITKYVHYEYESGSFKFGKSTGGGDFYIRTVKDKSSSDGETEITFSVASLSNYSADGGSNPLSITASNSISWTITRSDNWIHLGNSTNNNDTYTGTGTSNVNIYVDNNPTTERRKGTITVKSDIGTKEITFYQAGLEDKLEVDMPTKNFTKDGGTEQLGISALSSRSWTISCDASWLHFDTNSGKGSKKVKVTIDKNTTYENRNAVITIVSEGLSSKKIDISQKGKEKTLTLSVKSKSFDAEGGDFTTKVTTDPSTLDWKASKSKSWVHFDSKSNSQNEIVKSGDLTLTLTVDPNTSTESRSATISFTSDAETKSLEITQSGATFNVSPSTFAFVADGGNFQIEVSISPSLKWKASKSNSDSWIHFNSSTNDQNEISETSNKKITVYIDKNSTYDRREATLTFSSDIGKKTVKVAQGASTASLPDTRLGKILKKPFGTVDVDLESASYSTIKRTLSSYYRLDSNSGYFYLNASSNSNLSFDYRGLPFYKMYVAEYSSSVVIDYTFKIGYSSISDPGAMYDAIIADFKEIGIPLQVERKSNSSIHGYYKTGLATYKADINYSSWDSSWEYTIGVTYYE